MNEDTDPRIAYADPLAGHSAKGTETCPQSTKATIGASAAQNIRLF